MNSKLIKRIAIVLTICTVIGLASAKRKISVLTDKIEVKITDQEQEKAECEIELQELQDELASMDSIEYIEKVAKEELGMVDEDTIVIKAK